MDFSKKCHNSKKKAFFPKIQDLRDLKKKKLLCKIDSLARSIMRFFVPEGSPPLAGAETADAKAEIADTNPEMSV